MQACSLGVQLVGQLLGQANMLCILQTSKLDLVSHLHCITDWIIKARKGIIQQEMTQTFLYNLARLGLDHVSAGQPFLYNLARLGLNLSLPGLALTTYLLANPFCTAVLVIKDTHQQLWLHSTKQILFFLGFEQLRHDVLIIISARCLGSSKF